MTLLKHALAASLIAVALPASADPGYSIDFNFTATC